MTSAAGPHQPGVAWSGPLLSEKSDCRRGVVPLAEEFPHPPSPWEACKRLARLGRPLLLESALEHPHVGRYSFVMADPFEWLQADGKATSLDRPGGRSVYQEPFLPLAHRLARYRIDPIPGLPPFQGGAAGLFGFDLCHHLEALPRPVYDEFRVPELAIGFYDRVLAYDHVLGKAWIVSSGLPESDPSKRNARARQRLDEFRQWLCEESPLDDAGMAQFRGDSVKPELAFPADRFPGLLSNFSPQGYLKAVRRAIDYIHAGDCFQVNLSQRLLFPYRGHPAELYERLRDRNAAPFAGYFDLGSFAIASCSPERFLRVDGGKVETRPIKGTRPRGKTAREDAELATQLEASAKDRAENVMIVDLLRNDLGRVCRYGSVTVSALCQLESYRHVHHLVSVIRGELRPSLSALDLLRAAFPGGSVVGAPKIRALEIIAELERTSRGAYCGCLGYMGFDGSMDTSILIRTCTVGRGWVQFAVGGGIVADSIPEQEYEETWTKAKGILRSLRHEDATIA